MIMSAERVFAVHKPGIYKYYFTTKTKIGLVLMAIFVQMLLILTATLTTMDNYTLNASQRCAIISSTSIVFSTFHFTFIVFGYVVSVISLTIIYFLHKKATQGVTNTKGPKLFMFIVINSLDAVLLSSYSFVMIGARYGLFIPNDITISLVTSTTGLISLIHTAMNILFHEEYRRQISKFTRRIIGLHNTTTMNITPNFGPTSMFVRLNPTTARN
uniref:G-protein coupled receptors family 1 profile domain-containing protein n=1 Tax=Acrobeloides nanus TaxID=290746 RepID=A0A914EBT1_9BILA